MRNNQHVKSFWAFDFAHSSLALGEEMADGAFAPSAISHVA
jgi:hypothetical protein